jgi:hypothetical protein
MRVVVSQEHRAALERPKETRLLNLQEPKARVQIIYRLTIRHDQRLWIDTQSPLFDALLELDNQTADTLP